MLYLPVREVPGGGRIAEIRATEDGRRAMLAYTALDRLAEKCGDEQPWVVVPTTELDQILSEQPFDLVAFDAEIPATLRAGGRLV
jgi:hypothetical protein